MISGAIRIDPTTCMAWLSPVSAPNLPKVLADLKRSVARVTIEPLKLKGVVRNTILIPFQATYASRPNLY